MMICTYLTHVFNLAIQKICKKNYGQGSAIIKKKVYIELYSSIIIIIKQFIVKITRKTTI